MGIAPGGDHRFRLRYGTEIPMQAGLAGSTALMAATFAAIAEHAGRKYHKHSLAEAIRRIEYDVMGVICGFQDQHMAVYGGLNYMDFRDKGSHLPPDEQPFATVEPLADEAPKELPFLLAHTGVKHHSGQAHKPVRQRWLEGDPEVRGAYEYVQKLAREHKGAVLTGDWEALAAAMNENQRIAFELGASGKAVDDLIAVARENGALGAKLAGAGQGGTVLALTFEPEKLAAALTAAGAGRILYPAPSPGLTVTRR
jgi:galactokinase/mevalonate kinase-like predicted kinase